MISKLKNAESFLVAGLLQATKISKNIKLYLIIFNYIIFNYIHFIYTPMFN